MAAAGRQRRDDGARRAFYWSQGQPAGPGTVDSRRYDAVVLAAARARHGRRSRSSRGRRHGRAAEPGDAASPPRDARRLRALPAAALVGRYGPRRLAVGRAPGARRRGRSATGRSGTSRTSTATGRPSRSRSRSCALLRGARAGAARGRPGRARDPGRPAEQELGGAAADLRAPAAASTLRRRRAAPVHGASRSTWSSSCGARAASCAATATAAKPLWVTELSWPAASGKARRRDGFETTEKGQAQRLRTGLDCCSRAARRKLRIGRVYWYTWLSARGRPTSAFGWSGLRRAPRRRRWSARRR